MILKWGTMITRSVMMRMTDDGDEETTQNDHG